MDMPQQAQPQFDLASTRRSLVQALLDARAIVGGVKPILEDHDRTVLTYDQLVLASTVLGRKLSSFTKEAENVGVFLPNSVGTVVTFFALQFTARVPAMLNFTAGLHNLELACEAANVRTILTSRKFVEAGKFGDTIAHLGESRRIVYLEDVRQGLNLWDKLTGALRAQFAPLQALAHPDSTAAVLFTSGAEGAPKAVTLSHANLVANVEQIRSHIELDKEWVFFSPLPVFHSFGLTGGVLLPLLTGIRTFQYPSPLHHKQIPELIKDSGASVLLATDTFVGQYARAAADGELSSLKFVVCGAERVREETRRLMMERFGVPIVEGYGATELSPVICVNDPRRNRPGTVGQFLPGIRFRLEPIPGIDEGGRLLVRGPNVMTGYIGQDGKIAPPEGGWHDTGDVVTVDDERFVSIAGRLKRFAKIAGEMVSLNAVEAHAGKLWPDHAHAALTIADDRRGEQIVLLTDHKAADRQDLVTFAKASGWPELQLPRRVIVVDHIPVLGSGKTDYVSTEKLLKQTLAASSAVSATR